MAHIKGKLERGLFHLFTNRGNGEWPPTEMLATADARMPDERTDWGRIESIRARAVTAQCKVLAIFKPFTSDTQHTWTGIEANTTSVGGSWTVPGNTRIICAMIVRQSGRSFLNTCSFDIVTVGRDVF